MLEQVLLETLEVPTALNLDYQQHKQAKFPEYIKAVMVSVRWKLGEISLKSEKRSNRTKVKK